MVPPVFHRSTASWDPTFPSPPCIPRVRQIGVLHLSHAGIDLIAQRHGSLRFVQ
jgi:hypothetical protein